MATLDSAAANQTLVEELREATFQSRGRRALLFQRAADRITKLEAEIKEIGHQRMRDMLTGKIPV